MRFFVGVFVLLTLVWALTPVAVAGPKGETVAEATVVPSPCEDKGSDAPYYDAVPAALSLMAATPVPFDNPLGLTGAGQNNWLRICLAVGLDRLEKNCPSWKRSWMKQAGEEVYGQPVNASHYSEAKLKWALKFWDKHVKGYLPDDKDPYRGERHLIGAAQDYLLGHGILVFQGQAKLTCTQCMQVYMDCDFCYGMHYCSQSNCAR
jgi:hypothetical protein